MDPKNYFHTRTTYSLQRLDYLVALVALSGLALLHGDEIRWGPFLLAFVWIDLLGYVPGLIWYKRSRAMGDRTPFVFALLYNTTHSFSVNALVIGIWYLEIGGWEWAMLAGPIHLLGDRGIFGNIYKPVGLAFEPSRHPLFERFTSDFRRAAQG